MTTEPEEQPVEGKEPETTPTGDVTQQPEVESGTPAAPETSVAAEPSAAKEAAPEPAEKAPTTESHSTEQRILKMELRENLGLKTLEQADRVVGVLKSNPSLSHAEALSIAQSRNPVVFGVEDPRGPQQGQGTLPPSSQREAPAPEPTTLDKMREANTSGHFRERAQLARQSLREAIKESVRKQGANI